MKILKIKNYEVKVDDDLYELLKSKNWRICYRGDKYIMDGKGKYMHRLIIGVTDPNIVVDHIDRDTFNNQRSNLRPCTKQENSYNRNPISSGKSKYVGVQQAYILKKTGIIRWTARLKSKGKYLFFGYFKTEEEAALAYNQAALKHRGSFASINEIENG